MENQIMNELKRFARVNGLTIITVDKTHKVNKLGFYVFIFDNKTEERIYKYRCDELTDNVISHLYMFIQRHIAGVLKINI